MMHTDQLGQGAVADLRSVRATVIDESPDRRLFDTLDRTRSAGIDAMGAALSHELNQPLAAMLLYLQSLQRLCNRLTMPDPLINELIGKSLRETERAVDIVRRMRRFSASSEPARETVDINLLARDSVESSLSSAAVRPSVILEFDPNLPTVQADPVQIRQVMVNLLKNACEATSRQNDAKIVVSTTHLGGIVQFNVRDNGPGIDPKIADRLFRAFETSKPNGMGLGLAISRMIAQNHHGEIVFESGDGGKGANFGFRLPVR
jgi:two-component system sensor kinase FixL